MTQIPVDITLSALLLLVINGGALWIREWKKHRTWRSNGNHLKEIKKKVDDLISKASQNATRIEDLAKSYEKIGDLGEKRFGILRQIDRQVGEQAARCREITTNFRDELKRHGKKLNNLTTKKKG